MRETSEEKHCKYVENYKMNFLLVLAKKKKSCMCHSFAFALTAAEKMIRALSRVTLKKKAEKSQNIVTKSLS